MLSSRTHLACGVSKTVFLLSKTVSGGQANDTSAVSELMWMLLSACDDSTHGRDIADIMGTKQFFRNVSGGSVEILLNYQTIMQIYSII